MRGPQRTRTHGTLGGTSRLSLAVALAVASVSLAACSKSDPTGAMGERFESLELPAAFRFEAERRHAPDECQVRCPSVARYYSSDLEPADACDALEDPLRSWEASVSPRPVLDSPEQYRCGFTGKTDAGLLTVSVFADTEIESGVGFLHTERIEAPHDSVVRITINS